MIEAGDGDSFLCPTQLPRVLGARVDARGVQGFWIACVAAGPLTKIRSLNPMSMKRC